MKHARGTTRELLIVIDKMLDKIVWARALHSDDCNPNGYRQAQELLKDVCEMGLKTLGEYKPIQAGRQRAGRAGCG